MSDRSQRTRIRRAAEHARLRERIRGYLEQNGPTLFADLLERLDAPSGQMQKVGSKMKKDGELYVYESHPGVDSRRIWSLVPPHPRPKADKPKKSSGEWIDRDDIEWMDQQRRNAEKRNSLRSIMADRL